MEKGPCGKASALEPGPAGRAGALLWINTEVRSEASRLLKGATAQKEAEGLGRRAGDLLFRY